MMKRFRVAHIITRLCKGGAQENTFHTVRLANRERFDVDLISGPTSGAEGSIEDAVRAAGIEILREPDLVRNAAPLRDRRALHSLERRLREEQYDIVHTHTSKAGYLGRLAADHAGAPIIVHTPHGHIFGGYFSRPVTWFYTMLERHAARVTDRFIALTQRGIEEHLKQHIGRREQWRAIFSGIDIAPFDAAIERRAATRQALGIREDEILVGGVGRLEPVKGFTYFVEAAHAAAYAMPGLKFILAGDGSLRDKLEQQAEALGARMQFLGLRHDVPDLMAALDIFVLPSLNEGMGRVLLEAGAAGAPSVATAVGGVPDIIVDGKTGVLVAPREPAALARAILELAHDASLRTSMGGAARARIAPAYSIESMVRQIEDVYEELIEEKRLES